MWMCELKSGLHKKIFVSLNGVQYMYLALYANHVGSLIFIYLLHFYILSFSKDFEYRNINAHPAV